MYKAISICGPTASGKSALALAVCKEFNGELISCDSMQIYRKFDIGTAKPTKEEQSIVKHHMIDVYDATEPCSAVKYALDARACMDDVLLRGKLPVICGGTGLYLDALNKKVEYMETKTDEKLRESLLKKDKHELWCELKEIDAESAEKIHENNVKRVCRALEIYYTTGLTKTEYDKKQLSDSGNSDIFNIILDYRNREILYNRIERRCDEMISDGLIEEIKKLLDEGLLIPGTTAYQAIGYKEFLGYFNGEKTLSECLSDLKQATRNYAKRQQTWFKKTKGERIYCDDFSSFDELFLHTAELIKKTGLV